MNSNRPAGEVWVVVKNALWQLTFEARVLGCSRLLIVLNSARPSPSLTWFACFSTALPCLIEFQIL